MSFPIDSETGRPRQVILHRPGVELSRLTPDNVRDLLFDDILWACRAREEHDAFAEVLRERGVKVHYFAQLLADVLDIPHARDWVLDRIVTEDTVGPALAGPLRRLAERAGSAKLADHLIGGVLKNELAGFTVSSLRWELMNADDFVLAPLPDHLFQCDSSAWVYGGAGINPIAMPARHRESVHSAAIYRFHPMFTTADLTVWFGGDDRPPEPSSLEGSDIHVLGNGAVMVTTMIDPDTFVMYPYLQGALRSWAALPGQELDRLRDVRNTDPAAAAGDTPGMDKIPALRTNKGLRAVQGEQWNDGSNFPAVEPGVIVGYRRNANTDTYLRAPSS